MQASGSGAINQPKKSTQRSLHWSLKSCRTGTLVVAGRQEIKVNDELRELRMAGIVRPADILNDKHNFYEIAEARIAYLWTRGSLSRTLRTQHGEDAMEDPVFTSTRTQMQQATAVIYA
jgi:flagellar L-ring protein precursor FlgH